MAAATFSLERRLMCRLTLILAGSFLLFAVVYLFVIQNDSVFHASEEVGELARDLASAIQSKPDGTYAFSRKRAARHAVWPNGTAYAAIVLPGGEAVLGSDPSLLAELTHRAREEVSSDKVVEMPQGLSVLSSQRAAFNGTTFRIAVLRPMTMVGIAKLGLASEFTEEILPCFLPALSLAVAVTWLTIRRNLRPLRRASAEASAVAADNPGQRMSTSGLSAEIRPLIDAVNRALARLEDALSAQRRFTANAAHELRTPLAVLRARVDGMERCALRGTLTRDIERMTRAVSQMLLTSRLQAKAVGELDRVGLARLARHVVADLAPLAHAQGRDIDLEVCSRNVVVGSATALESALRNLIDNGLRFTPAGKAVTVRVGPGEVLSVEDVGPGVADSNKVQIFEPYWRAGAQSGNGAGLGLAIVTEVAALHGGSIRVEDTPAGGARFVLSLRGAVPAPKLGDGAIVAVAPGHGQAPPRYAATGPGTGSI